MDRFGPLARSDGSFGRRNWIRQSTTQKNILVLCVNDGKRHKRMKEQPDTDGLFKGSVSFLPGLRLALLCCRRFARFDWLRKFQRNRGILRCRENAKNYHFQNTTLSLNVVKTFTLRRFVILTSWLVRQGRRETKQIHVFQLA